MNTNSWEETAQRSLDAVDRRSIERGRTLSRRAVLLAVTGLAVGALGVIGFLASSMAIDGTPVWAVAGWVVSGLVFVASRLAVGADRRARMLNARERVLDERELSLQLAARADAYRWAVVIVMALAVGAQIALNEAHRDAGSDVPMQAMLYALFVFGYGVMPALPQVLHLLRSPDAGPANVDDQL